MADNSEKLSVKFIYAELGEQLIQRLVNNPHYGDSGFFDQQAVDIITYYNEGVFSAEDYSERSKFIEEIVNPVAEAFTGYVCPFYKDKPKQLNWVVNEFLYKPNLDLSKMAKNLMYFESVKQAPIFNGCTDLLRYRDYADLEKALAPFWRNKNEKDEEKRERHLDKEQRNKIMAETTLVYHGDEGKIVIPHTVFASKYWGNNTKWCVSGEKEAEEKFPEHNLKTPLVMFIPRGYEDEKVTVADNQLWDAKNAVIENKKLSEPHQKLFEATLASLSEASAENLKSMMPQDLNKNKRWAEELKSIKEGNSNDISEELWKNVDFVLEVVSTYGVSIKAAGEGWMQDKRMVIAAVSQNAYVIRDLDNEFRRDIEVITAAIGNDGDVLRYLDDDFKKDKTIVLMAVKQNGEAWKYAHETLQKDEDVITEAVKQNGEIFSWIDKDLLKKNNLTLKLAKASDDLVFNHSDLLKPFFSDNKIRNLQLEHLENFAKNNESKKFTQYARRFEFMWGDAEKLLGGKMQEAIVAIKKEIRPELGIKYNGSKGFSIG